MILHNDKDGAVDFNQGIEYYNTLRRLGKPVVMLQYKGENHGLVKPANQQDYARRTSSTGSTQSIAMAFTYNLAVADTIAIFVTTSSPQPTDIDTFVVSAQPYLAAVWLSA